MVNSRFKFRLWDKVCGKMAYPEKSSGFRIHLNGCISEDETWCTQDCELMQYTGLKDKNGKDIFEGDIVLMHQFLFDGEEIECELSGVVVYNNEDGSFGLNNIKSNWFERHTGCEPRSPESLTPICLFYGLHEESFNVIGNIYENKELLK